MVSTPRESQLLEEERPEDNPLRETAGARELMRELTAQLREGVSKAQCLEHRHRLKLQ